MGLVAQDVRRCYRQQQAMRELEQVGSVMFYRKRQRYDWFRSFFGTELHGIVDSVDLASTKPVDRLPDLGLLESITAVGLELPNLPQNINQLAELPKSEFLSVKLTSLGGADPRRLTELTSLPELWRLNLIGEEFAEAIRHISTTTRLEYLEIDAAKLTDEDLVRISELSTLISLSFDESVLKTLDCSVLTLLPNLRELTFVGKNLTAQDEAGLQLWPNAKIERGTTRDTWEPYISVRME
jgi:hypothetical protein